MDDVVLLMIKVEGLLGAGFVNSKPDLEMGRKEEKFGLLRKIWKL